MAAEGMASFHVYSMTALRNGAKAMPGLEGRKFRSKADVYHAVKEVSAAPAGGGAASFIDCNRGRVRPGPLAVRERAFDLSRLTLPLKARRIFREMYFRDRTFEGRKPPRACVRHTAIA